MQQFTTLLYIIRISPDLTVPWLMLYLNFRWNSSHTWHQGSITTRHWPTQMWQCLHLWQYEAVQRLGTRSTISMPVTGLLRCDHIFNLQSSTNCGILPTLLQTGTLITCTLHVSNVLRSCSSYQRTMFMIYWFYEYFVFCIFYSSSFLQI